jgi:hypothetical protein
MLGRSRICQRQISHRCLAAHHPSAAYTCPYCPQLHCLQPSPAQAELLGQHNCPRAHPGASATIAHATASTAVACPGWTAITTPAPATKVVAAGRQGPQLVLPMGKVAAISKTAVPRHPPRAQLGLQGVKTRRIGTTNAQHHPAAWSGACTAPARTFAFSAVPRKPRPPLGRGPRPALSKAPSILRCYANNSPKAMEKD